MNQYTGDCENCLEAISAEARSVANEFGAEWNEAASTLFLQRLTQRFGGTQVYIPLRGRNARKKRDEEVLDAFDGRNITTLARRFQISERSVRRIISSARK